MKGCLMIPKKLVSSLLLGLGLLLAACVPSMTGTPSVSESPGNPPVEENPDPGPDPEPTPTSGSVQPIIRF